jgi:hypothetical protein
MNTYEKHRGEGVLWLTRFPIRESVLRSIATKDLSSYPMRMLIPSECCESTEGSGLVGKDLSSSYILTSLLPYLLFDRPQSRTRSSSQEAPLWT